MTGLYKQGHPATTLEGCGLGQGFSWKLRSREAESWLSGGDSWRQSSPVHSAEGMSASAALHKTPNCQLQLGEARTCSRAVMGHSAFLGCDQSSSQWSREALHMHGPSSERANRFHLAANFDNRQMILKQSQLMVREYG